ncbi:unnamed protein product [Closterium sp. NIES-64]|nr:unnamed protein product [Closterium sp. NIES-64]
MRTKYEKMAAAIEEKRRATSAAVAAVQAGGGKRRITDYLEEDAAAAKRDAHEGLALMFAARTIPEVTMDHPLFINAMLLVNRAGNGYVPCATHVMDLLLEDVGKMGWAKGVVDRTGEMSSFVRNHHWTRAYLRTKELVEGKVLQLLKPAGTRFGTQYIAVSRLCQLRSTLNAMVLSDRWKEWASGSQKETAETFAARVLDDAWWRTAKFFCKLMQLPYKAMRQTDADANGMMGRLYDVMLQLTEDVNNILDEDEQQLSSADKEKIRSIIKDRWDNNLACAMHVAGRILNPANQEEDIFGSDAECTRVIKALINQHVEFLIGHDGKGRDEGPDYLLALEPSPLVKSTCTQSLVPSIASLHSILDAFLVPLVHPFPAFPCLPNSLLQPSPVSAAKRRSKGQQQGAAAAKCRSKGQLSNPLNAPH